MYICFQLKKTSPLLQSTSTGLEHNSLNLDQLKVKLCSNNNVLERLLCAKYGMRRSRVTFPILDVIRVRGVFR